MEPLEGLDSWRQVIFDARTVLEPFYGVAVFGVSVFIAKKIIGKTKAFLLGSSGDSKKIYIEGGED